MGIEVAGIGGFIVLVLNVWGIVSIIGSKAITLHKVLWCILILVFPIFGFVVWFFAGPRSAKMRI